MARHNEPLVSRGFFRDQLIVRTDENGVLHPFRLSMFSVDQGGEAPATPVTVVSESRVVEWCWGDLHTRRYLLGALSLPPEVDVYTEVTEPIIRRSAQKPGDVDVVCLPLDPALAVALEAKCIKVTLGADGRYVSNRLGKLRGGVVQANALHGLGFHRVWLWLLLLVNGSQGDARNVFYRMSDDAFTEVVARVRACLLHTEVGLVVSECIQPTPSSMNKMGGFMTTVIARPRERHQPTVLCEQLEELRLARTPLPVGTMDLDHRR